MNKSTPWRGSERERDYNRRWRAANPDKVRAQKQRDYQKHRDQRRRRAQQKKFGLIGGQYEEMLRRQGGVCAICKRPEMKTSYGKVKRLAVDHDHITGRVRGLLCSLCNPALGGFREDVDILASAIEYLRL